MVTERVPDQDVDWFEEVRLETGEVWQRIGRSSRGYIVRFEGLAEFVISQQGTLIDCHRESECGDLAFRHLLIDRILPLILDFHGISALHASAAARDGHAIAVTGSSSSGKSTLTASFMAAGWSLIADDCLAVRWEPGAVLANPGYPSLRLWNESLEPLFGTKATSVPVAEYTDKKRVDVRLLGKFASGPIPLRIIYQLDPQEASSISIEPLAASDAFFLLLNQGFRLDPTSEGSMRRQLAANAAIANGVRIRRLTYPQRFDALGLVRQAVESDMLSDVAENESCLQNGRA